MGIDHISGNKKCPKCIEDYPKRCIKCSGFVHAHHVYERKKVGGRDKIGRAIELWYFCDQCNNSGHIELKEGI